MTATTGSVDLLARTLAQTEAIIARATGQPTDLDPEVGQLALDWGRENLKPQFRGDEASGQSFGAEVAVDGDAPLYDRLAGFFGRDPS